MIPSLLLLLLWCEAGILLTCISQYTSAIIGTTASAQGKNAHTTMATVLVEMSTMLMHERTVNGMTRSMSSISTEQRLSMRPSGTVSNRESGARITHATSASCRTRAARTPPRDTANALLSSRHAGSGTRHAATTGQGKGRRANKSHPSSISKTRGTEGQILYSEMYYPATIAYIFLLLTSTGSEDGSSRLTVNALKMIRDIL